MDHIALAGRCLHDGSQTLLTLRRQPGAPLHFCWGAQRARLDELQVVGTDRGVRVTTESGLDLDLVEHLLAALGGLGVRSGLRAEVQGPELPLLDGGCLEFALAITALQPPATPPSLRITRSGTINLESSSYLFEPAHVTRIDVEVDFPGVGSQRASWDGTAASFLGDIAPARTFGFARDGAVLRQEGRAAWVDPARVLVLDDSGSPRAPARMARHELAKHKLLDLVGDLYLFGGPPQGRIRAIRPGHRANHEALRLAISRGLVLVSPTE